MFPRRLCTLCTLALFLGQACTSTYWRARFLQPAESDQLAYVKEPFVKVHTHDGHVYVLASWKVDSRGQLLSGSGVHYDDNRVLIGPGEFDIPFSAIALAESNQPERRVRKRPSIASISSSAPGNARSRCSVRAGASPMRMIVWRAAARSLPSWLSIGVRIPI